MAIGIACLLSAVLFRPRDSTRERLKYLEVATKNHMLPVADHRKQEPEADCTRKNNRLPAVASVPTAESR